MSLAAAHAMQRLANCIKAVADEMPPGTALQVMEGMAEAHYRCAEELGQAHNALEEKLGLPDSARWRTRG